MYMHVEKIALPDVDGTVVFGDEVVERCANERCACAQPEGRALPLPDEQIRRPGDGSDIRDTVNRARARTRCWARVAHGARDGIARRAAERTRPHATHTSHERNDACTNDNSHSLRQTRDTTQEPCCTTREAAAGAPTDETRSIT